MPLLPSLQGRQIHGNARSMGIHHQKGPTAIEAAKAPQISCNRTICNWPTATATNCNCGHLQLTNCNWHHLQLDQLQPRPTAGPCSRAGGRLDLCLRSQAQDEHRPGLRRRHQHYQQRENRPRLPRRRPRKQCKKAKQSRQERRRWWSSTSRAATTRENDYQHDKAKIQIKPT